MRNATTNAQIYRYCREHFLTYDRFPSGRQIQANFGFASQTSVIGRLERLRALNLIERIELGRYRFVDPSRAERLAQFHKSNPPE